MDAVKAVKRTSKLVARWRRDCGGVCPHCAGSDLETVGRDGDANYLTHESQCRGGGNEWTEIYTLSGIPNNEIQVPADAAGA